MGDIFSNSFKRELGKNTAKTVSNLVFGDNWSTPYRRINSEREQRLKEKQEAAIAAQEAREQRLRKKNNAVIASIEAREERERQNHLNRLDEAVLGNIDKLVAVPIPNDVNGLNNYLGMLSVQMKSIKFEKDIQEADIRNKYLLALIERYRQAVDELAYLNPTDRHLLNYVNLLIDREFEIKKFSKSKPVLVVIFSILLLPSLLLMQIGMEYPTDADFVIGSLATFINISVIYFCGIRPKVMLKKARKKELKKYEQLMSCNTEKQKPENFTQQTQHPEEIHVDNSQSSDDIFFDLNSDNRIGVALARIWSKYRGLVPDEILARRPIFAADGVKDCILFVGINPSFSENDDNNFIENDDKKLQKVCKNLGFTQSDWTETVLKFDLKDKVNVPDIDSDLSYISLRDCDGFKEYDLCLFKGFDHEKEKAYSYDLLRQSQFDLHYKKNYVDLSLKISIANKEKEHVAHCGVWFDSNSDFAVIEPVCVIPKYRNKKLGTAVVLEGLKRAQLRGAKFAIVGSDMEFYKKIGFNILKKGAYWVKK